MMAARELLFAGVAVVDGEDEATLDAGCDLFHGVLRSQRCFDAFSQLRMDRIAVEELYFLGRRLRPGFIESVVPRADAKGTPRTEGFDREGVEEFVREDDGRDFRGLVRHD